MGLFGSGALKRQIASLTNELETAQKLVQELESKCQKLETDLSTKDESFRIAKEGRQKAEKKLEKLAAKSMTSERKMTEMTAELDRVRSDLVEYRDTVLSARAESDRLKAKLARHTEPPKDIAPVESDATNPPPPQPVVDERRVDRRVARLQEQLENERAQKDDIKARALRAEQAIRDAGKKRASDAGKLDAKLREAQHALQSERKAYKILQLQYEGLLEGKRGQEQDLLSSTAQSAVNEASAEESANATPQTAEEAAPESVEQAVTEVSTPPTDGAGEVSTSPSEVIEEEDAAGETEEKVEE